MKKRIYRIVKEKCGIPQIGARWALVVTMIAATLTVGVALAQRRPAGFEQLERDERIAAEERERHALAEHRVNLEHRAQELKARLDQVKMELAELEESGKGESELARALRVELREMDKAMAHLEGELHVLESQRRGREMRPWNVHQPRNEILRRLEELSRETEFLLQGLADQRIGRNDETNMLYNRMRELNEQMRQVRRQLSERLVESGRRRWEFRREGRHENKILQMERLKERARQIELELEELGDENPERAEILHAELREIHGELAINKLGLEMDRLGLQEQARQLERRLQELGDSHPKEAQELRMQLDKIHQQMQRIERKPDRFERPWPRDEDPTQPGNKLHSAKLMIRREQIQAQMRELEHVLQELNEQEKAESEEARLHQRELRDLQELLKETENEIRKSEAGKAREHERDDLEREVQNLRKQMDGMNEQMSEMRELMRRLLEKKETPEAL